MQKSAPDSKGIDFSPIPLGEMCYLGTLGESYIDAINSNFEFKFEF